MLLANIPLNGMFDGIELGVVGYSSNSVVRILPSYRLQSVGFYHTVFLLF